MSTQLETFRVKRKRDQDSVQSLILESANFAKRSKKSSFYFKFARTETAANINSEQPILSLDEGNKITILSQPAIVDAEEHPELPPGTNEPHLTDDILSLIAEQESKGELATSTSKHKKPIRRKHQKAEPIESYHASSDYVYDVYQRSVIDEASKEEQLRIAHFTYDEGLFNFVDEKYVDTENEEVQDDLDIDSNAEDYYQNDYPEDEDNDHNEYLDVMEKRHLNEIQDDTGDLVMSDDEDDDFEIQHNKRRFSTKDYQAYKEGGILDNDREAEITNDVTQEGFDKLYDDMYNSEDEMYEGPTSFLDDGRASDDNEEQFKRNYFFKTDEDDELAIHRDKIFGKLENMINTKK